MVNIINDTIINNSKATLPIRNIFVLIDEAENWS